ncbi:hypothetical protein T484DRAFT_1811368 [Baffinella frigidus]|nr:hypothetical protein T484DRAFT_1811368 [Cryptophyta sp. CCMP2293]
MRSLVILSLLACSLVAPAGACKFFWQKPNAFRSAARRGDVESLRTQLLAGHDIDDHSEYDETALMSASVLGEAGSVRFLLGKGADTSRRDTYTRQSALDMAEATQTQRLKERARKGRSWNEKNPGREDAMLTSLSEIVELLEKAKGGGKGAKSA